MYRCKKSHLVPAAFWCALTGLGGCANYGTQPLDPAEVATTIAAADQEVEGVLRCVGRQLEAYLPRDQPLIVIGVERFTHKGLTQSYAPASLPLDATAMVEATINGVGPLVTYAPMYRDPYSGDASASPAVATAFTVHGGIEVQEAAAVDNTSIDIGITVGTFNLRLSNKAQKASRRSSSI